MKEFHRAMEESMKTAPRLVPQQGQGFQNFQPMKGFEGGNFQFAPGGDGKFFYQAGGKGDGRLGIAVEKAPEVLVEQLNLPKGQGVIVVQVVKDSPAEKAGIKAKDVLLTLGGKPVGDPADVVKLIGGIKPDQKVDVVVIRKGEKQTIKGLALPEGKKVELRKVETKPDGKGGLEFNFKDANIPDDLKKEIERHVRDAQDHAQKAQDQARREIERVQRDLPKIQDDARREVERAMKELPKIQGDLQKEIERMKAELRRMEAELERGGKGGTSGGKGEGGGKGKASQSNMSVTVNDGEFTIKSEKDGVNYNISGVLEDGKAVARRVTVTDGDKEYKGTVDKLPEQYRDAVKKMLGNVGGGRK
jgi:hypothetical protein